MKFKLAIIRKTTLHTLKKNRLKPLILATVMLMPLCGYAKDGKTNPPADNKTGVNYKQRHSSMISNSKGIYADGIKIHRDLTILQELQEERILAEDEIPAEDLYEGLWDTRYVNAYRSLEVIPDTFKVNLENFTMPTTGYITSNFGPRKRRMHYGIDLKVQTGDTIYAAFDGKVRVKNFERRGYGNYLAIRHPNGLETVYGHLSEFLVDENDVVNSGDPIALGGNTGRSTGAHLHLEFRFLGKPINPLDIVDFENMVCHKDQYVITPNTFAYVKKNAANNKYIAGKVKYHRVKKGDTLSNIARKYGTSIGAICKANNIKTSKVLRLGTSIRVS